MSELQKDPSSHSPSTTRQRTNLYMAAFRNTPTTGRDKEQKESIDVTDLAPESYNDKTEVKPIVKNYLDSLGPVMKLSSAKISEFLQMGVRSLDTKTNSQNFSRAYTQLRTTYVGTVGKDARVSWLVLILFVLVVAYVLSGVLWFLWKLTVFTFVCYSTFFVINTKVWPVFICTSSFTNKVASRVSEDTNKDHRIRIGFHLDTYNSSLEIRSRGGDLSLFHSCAKRRAMFLLEIISDSITERADSIALT